MSIFPSYWKLPKFVCFHLIHNKGGFIDQKDTVFDGKCASVGENLQQTEVATARSDNNHCCCCSVDSLQNFRWKYDHRVGREGGRLRGRAHFFLLYYGQHQRQRPTLETPQPTPNVLPFCHTPARAAKDGFTLSTTLTRPVLSLPLHSTPLSKTKIESTLFCAQQGKFSEKGGMGGWFDLGPLPPPPLPPSGRTSKLSVPPPKRKSFQIQITKSNDKED